MNTLRKGNIACLKFDNRALEKGYVTAVPVTEVRYDRILDDGKRLLRIQVKYCDTKASNADNSIQVNLRTAYNGRDLFDGYNDKEVDAVVIYLPSKNSLCWFDIKEINDKKAFTIRTGPTKNKQKKGIRNYEDYVW